MIRSLNSFLLTVIGGLIVAAVSTKFNQKLVTYIICLGVFAFTLLHIITYFKNRIRIKIIKQNFFEAPYSVIFEALNLGEKPNSIEEKIYFKCLLPTVRRWWFRNGQPYKCEFYLKGTDRLLEPHNPKIFTAISKARLPNLMFSWFRKYQFRPSRGKYSTIFVRNAIDNGIPYWRYKLERTLYRLFRILWDKDKVIVE
jgi:hypothetical protein